MGFSFFPSPFFFFYPRFYSLGICMHCFGGEGEGEREKGEREIFFSLGGGGVFGSGKSEVAQAEKKKGFLCFFRIAFSSFTRKNREKHSEKHSWEFLYTRAIFVPHSFSPFWRGDGHVIKTPPSLLQCFSRMNSFLRRRPFFPTFHRSTVVGWIEEEGGTGVGPSLFHGPLHFLLWQRLLFRQIPKKTCLHIVISHIFF